MCGTDAILCYTLGQLLLGPGGSVSIATHYRLDSLGIESQWGRFSTSVQTGPGVHPASCTLGTRSLLAGKQLGHCVDHPPLSSAKVKEREELYLHSSSGSLWAVLGCTSTPGLDSLLRSMSFSITNSHSSLFTAFFFLLTFEQPLKLKKKYIQVVPGGKDLTSGECSLGQTITI